MATIQNGIFVKLHAQEGQEAELSKFLASALPLANAEAGTAHWFAVQFDPQTYGIFDTFSNETDRQAHLNGPIAKALMANAATLLSRPPLIEKIDILASK